ncbi:MAG: site-2 protease family protein, partial [Deltaproteobacteria bacterium]|nr:site-2 protease family protein [Deltaproteobacteria bacterium]
MSWFYMHVIVPILVIGVLILIHEMGHFLVAKWCGVGVVKFSIGFGPSICRWKHGETVYQISAIPLGGFVRMVGDIPDALTGPQKTDDIVRELDGKDGEAKPESEKSGKSDDDDEIPPELLADRNRWFVEKNYWQRSAIVVAGPLFNLVSAYFFVLIAGMLYGEDVPREEAQIGGVMRGSPAESAGLLPGDRVLRFAESEISSWKQLATRIHDGPNVVSEVVVVRGDETRTLTVTPQRKEIETPEGTKFVHRIGIEPAFVSQPVTVKDAFGHAWFWTWNTTKQTYEGLWGMVAGHVSPEDLAGPLFIFDAASQYAKKGLQKLLYFMAILSVSLAVLNLLPIPV